MRSDLPFYESAATEPGIWSSGIKKCEKTYLTSSPAPWHTRCTHVDTRSALAKGYANAERAVWKLFSSLPLSFSRPFLLSCVSSSFYNPPSPPRPPPHPAAFGPSTKATHTPGRVTFEKRVSGFFRCDQRAPGCPGWGMASAISATKTGLDGLLDTRDQPPLAISLMISHDLSRFSRSTTKVSDPTTALKFKVWF